METDYIKTVFCSTGELCARVDGCMRVTPDDEEGIGPQNKPAAFT